jgi:hypothetical protein
MTRRLVALTAPGGARKDHAAKQLQAQGWQHLSTGDVIRRHLKGMNLSIDRMSLNTAADYSRMTNGGGFLVQQALWSAQIDLKSDGPPILVTGIRAMGEVHSIREYGGEIVLVDADFDVRLQRRLGSLREGDEKLTPELFKQQDDREIAKNELRPDWMLHLWPVMQSADITLQNNGSLSEFSSAVARLLSPS